jgi:hypothetical protein
VVLLAPTSSTACHLLSYNCHYSRGWLNFCSCLWRIQDRLCGLVVRVPGYRSRGLGFDSRGYQIFWEVVDLEQDPLSLVRITEELLERKSSGSGLENRNNGRRHPLYWPRDTLYPQKLSLTSPTSGGRSVGIVHLRTKSHGVMMHPKYFTH